MIWLLIAAAIAASVYIIIVDVITDGKFAYIPEDGIVGRAFCSLVDAVSPFITFFKYETNLQRWHEKRTERIFMEKMLKHIAKHGHPTLMPALHNYSSLLTEDDYICEMSNHAGRHIDHCPNPECPGVYG